MWFSDLEGSHDLQLQDRKCERTTARHHTFLSLTSFSPSVTTSLLRAADLRPRDPFKINHHVNSPAQPNKQHRVSETVGSDDEGSSWSSFAGGRALAGLN